MPAIVLVASILGGCWLPPVSAAIADPFRPPACPWCPGNRGIEYDTPPGTTVRTVASGEVTFSGTVAGTGYLVIRHADGRRVTYGGLLGVSAREGDAVVARAVIGRTLDRLHLGVRDGDRYLDPAPHLGRLVGRPRLLPDDGTPPRPSPPPRLRCSARSSG